MENLKEVACEM